jgi:hypothetical protein
VAGQHLTILKWEKPLRAKDKLNIVAISVVVLIAVLLGGAFDSLLIMLLVGAGLVAYADSKRFIR